MIRVRFDPVEVLPSVPIHGCGPISEAFLASGVTDLTAAATWLAELPYGPNDVCDVDAVFRDGCGTCTTKHGAFIHLAGELGVDVELRWGVYALDDSIVAGAGRVLAEAGIPFVPNIHCFVRFNGSNVDLTRGNCTGKRLDIEDYLDVVAARFGDSEADACARFAEHLHHHDERFRTTPQHTVMETRDACLNLITASCATES